MWKQAIDQRSPMHDIENIVHKGLGAGNLGAITSRPGIGKTACMMQIGINELIHERDVLHVSINQTASRVRDEYDELLRGIARTWKIENRFDALRAAVERHRHLHGYTTERFEIDHLVEALDFLAKYADFKPSVLLLDGLDGTQHDVSVVDSLAQLAATRGLAIWMALVTDADDKQALPSRLGDHAAQFTQILHLAPADDRIALQVVKNGGDVSDELKLHLDTSTMLVTRD